MAERPVVNASPLIYLSRAGLLELLRLAGPEVVVPRIVWDEIGRKGPSDVTVRSVASTEWLTVVDTEPPPAPIVAWGLGDGESAVLAWALARPGAEAILDDLAGRRCAAALGVPVRGTLGLVLLAKRRGAIPSAADLLDRLRRAGMYLGADVMRKALALVGE